MQKKHLEMHVTGYEVITLVLTFCALIFLPGVGLMITMIIKWTRTQSQIAAMAEDVKDIRSELREDRNATNHRLRWLEENMWNRPGEGKHAIRDKD